MGSDANVDAQAEADPQSLMFDISDDELERVATADHAHAANTAFCSQWWLCPF
jgi:hypothetical protein